MNDDPGTIVWKLYNGLMVPEQLYVSCTMTIAPEQLYDNCTMNDGPWTIVWKLYNGQWPMNK